MRDLAVTLVAELILASSAPSPSPPQGNTPAQGGVTSLLPARVFYGRSGTALSCVVFDREPAASPPARHSCGTLAATAQIVLCARIAARGKASSLLLPWELRVCYLGLPQHPSEQENMCVGRGGELYCFVPFQCRQLKIVNHM